MKNFVFIFLFSLITFMGFSQNTYEQYKAQYEKYRKDQKQDSALFYAKELNSYALKNEGKNSIVYEESLKNLINCMQSLVKNDTTFDKVYQKYLLNLFVLYYQKGNYDSAVILISQHYLPNIERNDGKYSCNFIQGLMFKAILYYHLADYQSAEIIYKEAIDLADKIEDCPNHLKNNLNSNLGVLYHKSIGDFKSGKQKYIKSIANYQLNGFEDSLAYAKIIQNLAMVELGLKEYDKAMEYSLQSLKLFSLISTDDSSSYAYNLNTIGEIYFAKNKLDSAFLFYNKVLNIYNNKNGSHDNLVTLYQNYSQYYLKMGDNDSSRRYFLLALDLLKNKLGVNHPDYYNYEISYAFFLANTNDFTESFELLKNGLLKKQKKIMNYFEWLNDNQKELFWKNESPFFDELSYYANMNFKKIPEATALNYDAALLSKSKLLEIKLSSENYYRDLDDLREKLSFKKKKLFKMESEGSSNINEIDSITNEVDLLDKQLTLSWPEYAQQKKNLSISWEQVQQNLDYNEAAIEFVNFMDENDSIVYYNALIVRKDYKYPKLIKLCKENDIASIPSDNGYFDYYRLIWSPMEGYLSNIKTIYFAPSGKLLNVPFQALHDSVEYIPKKAETKVSKRGVELSIDDNKTEGNAIYLMDRFTLHQLTSTRYLAMGLKQKEKEPIPLSITMVGGVNYDYLPNTNSVLNNNSNKKKLDRSAPAAKKLSFLSGTKLEIDHINSTLSSLKWSTIKLENNDATEENIMKQEGKEAKGILHISTHGYAFPEFNFNDSTINKNSLRYSYRYSQNPMVRSGLILTGGNWAWMGSDTLTKMGAEQNGILTALEVSQLNLRKTKLVVLSACETGLGKIEGSEGTFGLKRAFKLAGVENIIVSLWSVPDDQTMELMTIFYTDLAKTLNPVVSFAKAQKDMRNKYPYQPALWSGFVLVR